MFKLIINAFYGRWGMSGEVENSESFRKNDVESLKKLRDILKDDTNKVVNMEWNLKQFIELKYKKKSGFHKNATNTCLPIASFTTAYARCMLHRIMRHVGMENVLYSDTDSVIFVYRSDEPTIGKSITCKNGNKIRIEANLGGLTDELEGDGFVDEFIAHAPKTYAYNVVKPDGTTKKAVKSKGYASNGLTEKIINFANMKHLILDAYKHYGVKKEEKLTKPMVSDLSRVYLDEQNLDTSFQTKYLQFQEGHLKNMVISKQFVVKRNKHITVKDSWKKFDLSWKNDKREVVKSEEENPFCIDTVPIIVGVN